MRLIKSFETTPKGGDQPGGKRYRFTLAFYPLEPEA